MSGQVSPLKSFTNTLLQFFDDLTETYPEEKDIKMATEALKAIKASNPRLLLTMFMTAVHGPCRDSIMNRDEEAVIKIANEILNSQYSEISFAFWIFDKHWKTMSEQNKNNVWKYITALVILAEKATA
jgi:hypothetical protein